MDFEHLARLALGLGIVFLALFLVLAAICTALWPERVFKRSGLSGWRLVLFMAALMLVAFLVGDLTTGFFGLLFPGFKSVPHGVYTVGKLANDLFEATILFLPWLLFPRLRQAVKFDLRWTWVALNLLLVVLCNLSRWGEEVQSREFTENLLLICNGLLTGFNEELIFRGYAFQAHPERQPKTILLATSLAFFLMHIPRYLAEQTEIPWRAVFVFSFGLILGIIRLSTGSIGLCILLHGLIDASAFLGHGWSSPLPRDVLYVFLAVSSVTTLSLHPKLRAAQGVKDPDPEPSPALIAAPHPD